MKKSTLSAIPVSMVLTLTSCQSLFGTTAQDFAAFQKATETDLKAHTRIIAYKKEEMDSEYNWDTHIHEIRAKLYFVAQDGSMTRVDGGDYYKYGIGDSYYNNNW